MKYLTLLITLFIIISQSLWAQDSYTDSLKSTLETSKDDTYKVNALIALSEDAFGYDPDEAIRFGTEAHALALRLNNKRLQGKALKVIGIGYYIQGDFEAAVVYWENSLNTYEEVEDIEGVANLQSNIGAVYSIIGLEASALEFYSKSLQNAEKIDNPYRIASALLNIGFIYSNNPTTFDKAFEFYWRALSYTEKTGDKDLIGTALGNLGETHFKLTNYDSAKYYFEKSLKQNENSQALSYSLNQLGRIYSELNELEMAVNLQKEAVASAEKFDAKLELSIALVSLATTYQKQGNTSLAIQTFNEALKIARDIGAFEQIKDVYKNLSSTYIQLSDFQNAYKYQVLFDQLKDSIYNVATDERIKGLTLANEFSRKKSEEIFEQEKSRIKSMALQNRIIFLGAIGVALIISAISLVIWRFFLPYLQRTREHQRRLEIESTKLDHEKVHNKRLKQLDRLKDQFLANTSHELRTPLNGIIGLAESLKDGVAGDLPQKAVHDLDMITSSGKRLENLVNDILDFSKLKNNVLTLQKIPVDINSIIEVVIYISKPLMAYKEIVITNRVNKDIALVEADENRTQQILHNLIGNAIKFTEAGTIEITAREQESEVMISVTDSGIGIESDKLDKIFDSFQQAEGSSSREYGGTGLGLSVTKQLVELQGGHIVVESTPSKGSTFSFTLPKSNKKTKLKEGMKLAGQRGDILRSVEDCNSALPIPIDNSFGEKIKILIVDDEPVNLQVLSNQLSLLGYQVELANSGKEALSVIQNNPAFDLIILDVMMPKMSGYEVCRKVRESYPTNKLPIIMLTAKNQVADLVEGFDIGANDYITKPFSKEELATRIKTHLRLNKISKATGKFVPDQFLKAIEREMITEVELGDHAEKNVTVLFSDIRDFTTISEALTPKENFNLINNYNRRMGPVIRQYNGFVNQYQGDAIMAIFPHNADEALESAIEMNRVVRKYNDERNSEGKEFLKVGMGIHTGNLIMGITGDSERLDTTTISDSVNIASRLESMSKHYKVSILLSEDSLNSMIKSDNFNIRYLGRIQLKGKKKEIGIYECIDGDDPVVREMKMSTLDTFNEGVQYFFSKEFPKATVAFEEILKINPYDLTAKLFMNKAAQYISSGVTEDWTGVEAMEMK